MRYDAEDLGRGDGLSETTVVFTGSVVKPLCPANPIRTGLVISPGTGSLLISTQPNPTTTRGWQLNSTAPFVVLSYNIHGALVTSQWFGIPSIALTVTVIETFASLIGDNPSTDNQGVQPWTNQRDFFTVSPWEPPTLFPSGSTPGDGQLRYPLPQSEYSPSISELLRLLARVSR